MTDGPPFEPRVALASISGRSDASWVRTAADHVGCAFLGGVAVDEPTREAARELVARDRVEFLPPDPLAFVEAQLRELVDVPVRPGVNVRTTTLEPLADVADLCCDHAAIVEINAHCRQAEMCATGSGEALLRDPGRLRRQVEVAADTGATVSVKVRAEVDGVDLPSLSRDLVAAGAGLIHVDAMDSEPVVAAVADAVDTAVVANNEVRDRDSVREYLDYGADAVSVGRPSDDPRVLRRVRAATDEWFQREAVQ